MCGFSQATRKYSRGYLLHPLIFKVMLYPALLCSARILAVYNGGSFLNHEEIPECIPAWLCRRIAGHPTLDQLFIESRPEYVTPAKVGELVNLLGKKLLKVGIGLECVHDTVRERCVHKGFSLTDYDAAVEALHAVGAKVLTYVFLKPPYLSERESIEEAVDTIEYALRNGDEVALEAGFVQKGTVMHRLYLAGQYRPPWLWSILEVIERTRRFGRVHVGGFSDSPPPIAIPHNCNSCSQTVAQAIQHFRETADPLALSGLSCECLQEWMKEVKYVKGG